jgi:Tol biopolymer transport system component
MSRLLLILTVFFFYSCSKDNTLKKIDDNDCEDFNSSWSPPTGPIYYETGYQFESPYFNPNNPNEFLYTLRNKQTQEYKLMKYNINTNVKTEILTNVRILEQAKWSKKGWIAFVNLSDYQVYIIKENGDSLRQFSSNSNNYYPAWSSDGKFLIRQFTPTSGSPYHLLKQELYSFNSDTIYKEFAFYNEISNTGKIVSKVYLNGKSHIAFSDVNNINFSGVVNLEDTKLTSLDCLSWSNDGETVYFTSAPNGYSFGLFRVDINNKKLTKLIDFCDTKRYTTISCSSDGKTLVAQRIHTSQQVGSNGSNTGNFIVKSSVYLINIQTLEESKVEL